MKKDVTPAVLQQMLTDAFSDAITCDATLEHKRFLAIYQGAVSIFASGQLSIDKCVDYAYRLMEMIEDRQEKEMDEHEAHLEQEQED